MNKILFILLFILVKVVVIILMPFKILIWFVECLEAIINAIQFDIITCKMFRPLLEKQRFYYSNIIKKKEKGKLKK